MGRGSLIELIDRDEALQMDAELVQMACSQTVVRLSIGGGFVALGMGWQELGFSTFAGYVRERCTRSGRWGEDTRALAARLRGLPRIRERLASGAIGWCMAEVLARFATADDEEELLEATRGMTVRQVKRALRERGGEADGEEEVRCGALNESADLEEAWALEASRPMVELVTGSREPGAWLASMLAEAQCALSNIAPEIELLPEDVAQRQEAWLASIVEGERRIDRREALAERSLPPMPAVSVGPLEEMPCGSLAIDRVLVRELAPRLASCDLRFGRLLGRFFAARGWRVLGFGSEKQYAQERLGMSRSAVHARIALARRAVHLEKVGDALRDGAIGYEAATLIARVATPDTEAQWVERARVRTFKHLREEVNAVELITRMMRADDPPGPPTDEEIAIVQALERDMKSGAYARRAFGIEREDDAPARLDALTEHASGQYAEMARTARTVQEALRTVIARAREGAGSLTGEEAESACTGVATSGELPAIDLEDDLVGSSAVQMFGSGATPDGANDATTPSSQDAVQMFGAGELSPSCLREGVGGRDLAGEATASCPRDSVQMFGSSIAVSEGTRRALLHRRAKVNLRMRATEDTILHYRMLKAAYERSGLGGSFLQFVVLAFWSSWAPVLGRTNVCEEILRRDGYECTCPVCGRPAGPGSHHVHPKGRGGGDEPTNLTSPCEWCHLDGVHGGRMRVEGDAPDLVWLIGRTPIMEVRGRERRLLA